MEPGKPSQALTLAEQRELAKRVILTPQIADAIAENVASGMFERQSCEFVGIDYAVYRQWKKWGSKGIEPYTTFFRRIQRVQQDKVQEALNAINTGHPGWKAQAWWLERVYPHWREDNHTDDPPPTIPVDTVIREVRSRFSPEEIHEIVKQLALPDPDDLLIGQLPQGGSDGGDSESGIVGSAAGPVATETSDSEDRGVDLGRQDGVAPVAD